MVPRALRCGLRQLLILLWRAAWPIMVCQHFLTTRNFALHDKPLAVLVRQGPETQCCALQVPQEWVITVSFFCGLQPISRLVKLSGYCRFMFGISNTRYPVADVKLQNPNGAFYSLTRGVNNMWSADGGPYNPPLIIQACHCSVSYICTSMLPNCCRSLRSHQDAA